MVRECQSGPQSDGHRYLASSTQQAAAPGKPREGLVDCGSAAEMQQFFGSQRGAFRQFGSTRQNSLANCFHGDLTELVEIICLLLTPSATGSCKTELSTLISLSIAAVSTALLLLGMARFARY
jgi:hypothetical protein